jgi:hypothetical protein
MNTKVCTNLKCRKELPATPEFFHKKKGGKSGVASECKECLNKRNNPPNTDLNIKQVCTGDCGEEKPATLQFFHRNKKNKFGVRTLCKVCVSERNNAPNTDASIKQVCVGGCGQELPATLEFFHKNKGGRFGVQAECKVCAIKNRTKYRKTPKGKAIHKNMEAKRRTRKRTQTQFFWTPNQNLIGQIYLVCPKGYEVDHMVPLSKGGDHHESNLCYLPTSVNISKKDRSIEEFGVDSFNKNVIYWQDILILLL